MCVGTLQHLTKEHVFQARCIWPPLAPTPVGLLTLKTS